MCAKNKDYPHDEVLKVYEELVANLPCVQRKGKKNPYTSVNGHMFSFLDADGMLSMRFSEERKDELIAKHDAGPSIQYNSVMRGYVLFPESMLAETTTLLEYLQESYEYACSLKPKK